MVLTQCSWVRGIIVIASIPRSQIELPATIRYGEDDESLEGRWQAKKVTRNDKEGDGEDYGGYDEGDGKDVGQNWWQSLRNADNRWLSPTINNNCLQSKKSSWQRLMTMTVDLADKQSEVTEWLVKCFIRWQRLRSLGERRPNVSYSIFCAFPVLIIAVFCRCA